MGMSQRYSNIMPKDTIEASAAYIGRILRMSSDKYPQMVMDEHVHGQRSTPKNDGYMRSRKNSEKWL